MQENRSHFRVISDNNSYQELLQNSRFQINSVYVGSGEHLQVHFSEIDELHISSGRCNVIIASFTTCHARIMLFNELKKLGKRVLYFVRIKLISFCLYIY
jgi:hypothetical protein